MANITGVTSLLATASETYTNNLSASISAGAGTVPVNANTEYTDGQVVVLTVDAGTASEATFTGIKASTPARFTNCVWTEGNTGVGHSSGATIVDYDSATHFNMLSTNVQAHANQDGTLKTSAVQAALNISAAVPEDYTALAQTMTTVVANGNRSYTGTFPAVDYSDRLSAGKRLRTVRSVAAPTQCATFDGTNDYFSKTAPAGMTFTDDFTVGAWIKVSSYSQAGIVSRGTGVNGWYLELEATGQLAIAGFAGSAYRGFTTYQSVPLNKWVHVAATLNMSANTSEMYIDGVLVPSAVIGGSSIAALTNSGDFKIGSFDTGRFFPGKIAQAFVASSVMSQANVRLLMTQGLTPALITANNIISAYSLDNSLTDLNTTSANNLTANGGVLATTADSPFGGQADGTISTTVDYGIIQKVSYGAPDTTVTFQVPEGCTVPTSGGVASVSYSAYKSPYGFPAEEGKWSFGYMNLSTSVVNTPGAGIWYNGSTTEIKSTIPIGAWKITFGGMLEISHSPGGTAIVYATLSTAGTTSGGVDNTITTVAQFATTAGAPIFGSTSYLTVYRNYSSATLVYVNLSASLNASAIYLNGALSPTLITAVNAYL